MEINFHKKEILDVLLEWRNRNSLKWKVIYTICTILLFPAHITKPIKKER